MQKQNGSNFYGSLGVKTSGLRAKREGHLHGYRLLGNSGLRVSEAALGTMTFGEEWGWGSGKEEARNVYRASGRPGAISSIRRFVHQGTSETYLGDFMKGHRESVVMATKYTNAGPGQDPNAAGNQRKNMTPGGGSEFETTTDRLHRSVLGTHLGRTHAGGRSYARLDDLVRQGKVLYAGISDAPAWWIAQRIRSRRLRGWSPFVGLQIEYSLTERTVERELIRWSKALNIGVTAWSPLPAECSAGNTRDLPVREKKLRPGG